MAWYRHLLWPFAIIYGTVVLLRNLLFSLGILPSRSFDVPVISVGNLETGGTGKSPVVIHIAGLLLSAGLKVAIVSRGYGRITSGFRMVETSSSAADVGDEPLQAKRRLPNATVAVGENRVKAIDRLLAADPPDVVIMDDGYQHRWVKPSLNILITSIRFPFTFNFLLPVGTLRESMFAARRSDMVVFTGAEESELDSSFTRTPNFYFACTNTKDPVQLSGAEIKLGHMAKVVLLSGIAMPIRFKISAEQRFTVVEHLEFRDHHRFQSDDMKLLREKMDSFGAEAVVTTEKDAVRLMNTPELNELGKIPVFYLPIEVEMLFGKAMEFEKRILEHGKSATKDQ